MFSKKQLRLVRKAMQGDESAFQKLCAEKGTDFLYYAIHMLGNPQDAEDAVQEIFIYMHRHITDLRSAEAFPVWSYRIIRSTCVDLIRKKQKETVTFDEGGIELVEGRRDFIPYEYAEQEDKKELLLAMIENLPEKCKSCVLLFYYEDMSYEQIAEIMQITKKDVDNALTKAKKELRKVMGKDEASKEFLSRSILFPAAPVLQQVLNAQAKEWMTRERIQFVRAAVKATGDNITAGAGGGIKQFSGRNGMHSTGSLIKVSAGILTTAGVAAGTIYYYQSEPEQPAEQVWQEEIPESEIVYHEEPVVMIEEEKRIETLEDMIGEELADHLRSYVREEQVELAALQDFIDAIEAESEETIGQPDIGQQDTLYALLRQEKQLLLIVRQEADDGTGSIAYKFTKQVWDKPRSMDIVFAFDEWKMEESE